MRTRYAIVLVSLAGSAVLLLLTGCGGDSSSASSNNLTPNKAVPPPIPPGYSSTAIHVKFREGTNVDLPLEALPTNLRDAVISHTKLFSLPKQKLNELRDRETSRLGKTLPNLNLWFSLPFNPARMLPPFLQK